MKIASSFALLALGVSAFAQANQPAPAKTRTPAGAKAPAGGARPAAAKTKPAKAKAKTAAAPSAAAPDGKAVLTVGAEKITADQFEAFVDALPEQYRAQARGPMKRQVAQDLVRVKLLAAEARRRGLDQNKETQGRIAFAVDNLLAGAVYKELLDKSTVDDAAMRKHYDANKNDWEQSQARHILVRFKGSPAPLRPGQKELSDEEALAKTQELRKKIIAGEDFGGVAKAESDDTGSGANGGELGTFKRGAMVPAFDQVAFSLPVGQISEPVKTQFGYHIIKVEKRDTKTFEEAKPEIENKLRPEIARSALENMLTNANVVYDDAYFGPEESKSPAPGKPPIQTQPDNKK
jgi:peptidyl-prolyl cis-trans isomerase C